MSRNRYTEVHTANRGRRGCGALAIDWVDPRG